MNLFAGIKKLFNKNIDCDEDMTNHIVFYLKKKKYLYLNKNIVVRDGSACVIVYKHKVRDVILPGKYKINEQSIPVLYSKAKVDKRSKKGAKARRIRADIYYVNTNEIKSFDFDSKECFVIKSKDYGRIKGLSQGLCTLKVIDAGLLVKALLVGRNVVKTKHVHGEIGYIIGNKINKRIHKDKITINMMFNNNDRLNAILNNNLQDSYDNVGLYVKDIKLKAINFPKRSQKKINKYLAEHKKVVKTSSLINSNWQVRSNSTEKVTVQNQNNTIQNNPNIQKVNTIKICPRCGFKNNGNASSCRNCTVRL